MFKNTIVMGIKLQIKFTFKMVSTYNLLLKSKVYQLK